MAGILDQLQAVTLAQRSQAREIAGQPAIVNGDDRAGAVGSDVPREKTFQGLDRDESRVGLHVDKRDLRPAVPCGVGAGDERDRRDEDQVPRADPERQHPQVQGGCARADCHHGRRRAERRTQGALEVGHRRSLRQPIAAQHPDHGGDIVLIDGVPRVGDGPALGHGPAGRGPPTVTPMSPSVSRMRSTVSQRLFLSEAYSKRSATGRPSW